MNNAEIKNVASLIKSTVEEIDFALEGAEGDRREELLAAREKAINVKCQTAYLCPVCGRPVDNFAGKAGRKKTLHNECREFQAAFNRLSTLAEEIEFAEGEVGESRLKKIRGDVFALLNQTLHKKMASFGDATKGAETRERADSTSASVVVESVDEAADFLSALTAELGI